MSRASLVKHLVSLTLGVLLLGACTSGQIKARKEAREKASHESHIYCEFVNGEVFPDVDVAVNLGMADHCNSDGSMTLTSYRSPSEAVGLVYCCSMKDDVAAKAENKDPKFTKKSDKAEKAVDKPAAKPGKTDASPADALPEIK